MNVNHHISHYVLGWVYKRKGAISKVIECFETVSSMDNSPVFTAALSYAHGLNRHRGKALALLNELEKQSNDRYVSSYARALVHIGLDEKDQAFACLDKAFEERSEMLPWLDVGAEYDSLRVDARFLDLRWRVGLRPINGTRPRKHSHIDHGA